MYYIVNVGWVKVADIEICPLVVTARSTESGDFFKCSPSVLCQIGPDPVGVVNKMVKKTWSQWARFWNDYKGQDLANVVTWSAESEVLKPEAKPIIYHSRPFSDYLRCIPMEDVIASIKRLPCGKCVMPTEPKADTESASFDRVDGVTLGDVIKIVSDHEAKDKYCAVSKIYAKPGGGHVFICTEEGSTKHWVLDSRDFVVCNPDTNEAREKQPGVEYGKSIPSFSNGLHSYALPPWSNNIGKIATIVHDLAKAKGFYDKETSLGEKLMLIVSELGEAIEADRKKRSADLQAYREAVVNQGVPRQTAFERHVKDSLADELADAVIRLLDLCAHLGIDIAEHVMLKTEYNAGRPRLHGKKY